MRRIYRSTELRLDLYDYGFVFRSLRHAWHGRNVTLA
jgi:hypothetical protein